MRDPWYVIIELTEEAEGVIFRGVRVPPGTQTYWPDDEPIPLGWKCVSPPGPGSPLTTLPKSPPNPDSER
jgi:hypothetical protein